MQRLKQITVGESTVCPLIDVSTYIVMQSLFQAMTLVIFYDEYFKEYVSITSGGEGLDG